MKQIVRVGLGVLSGLLLNVEIGAVAVILAGGIEHLESSWVGALGAILWTLLLSCVCTFILLYRSAHLSSVFMRGCAMGLVLWTAMIPLATYLGRSISGPAKTVTGIDSLLASFEDDRHREAADKLATLFTTTASVMIVVSAAAFAAVYLATRRQTSRSALKGVRPTA